jgi:cation diffusion facilitator family transporter
MEGHSTKHVVTSLFVNLAITLAKGVAAFFTGSGAMLAETIHSAADCGNQALLLVGIKRAARKPDALHPLGYGRALYFWSFVVALLLFTGGGVFSIYEGVHKLQHPEMPENLLLAVGILVFSLVLEGGATFGNVRALHEKRGATPFWTYLRKTTDSDLVVVFGENAAATLGLFLALVAILASHVLHDPKYDALGTLAIGVVLVGVAIFLAVEIVSLLEGEAADPALDAAAVELVGAEAAFKRVLQILSVQQGPGEVMMALKVELAPEASADEVCRAINDFEHALRSRHPELKWVFVEPDLPESAERSIAAKGGAVRVR